MLPQAYMPPRKMLKEQLPIITENLDKGLGFCIAKIKSNNRFVLLERKKENERLKNKRKPSQYAISS